MVLPKYIFGMGTGRCGTVSLSELFKLQYGFCSEHESVGLPWEVSDYSKALMWKHLFRIANAVENKWSVYTICNTSFVWIKYADEILNYVPGSTCVCLQRPKQEVVESFVAFFPNGFQGDLIEMFPDYGLPFEETISRYYDEYYTYAEMLKARFKNFKVFDTSHVLNTREGQREMLSFVGVAYNRQVIKLGIKLNERGESNGS